MSTRERETGIVRGDGDGGRLQLDSVQRSSDGSAETNWHAAFLVLSQALGREMVSSTVFYFCAKQLEKECGREAAIEFLATAGSQRSSFMNEFMG